MTEIRRKISSTYLERTPTSRQYHQTARACMPGGDTRTIAYWEPYPLYTKSGSGCRICDVDDNSYIDFVNNYTSLILGHAHPSVQAAVKAQISRGSAYATAIPVQIELAEVLQRRVPSVDQVRFCNSGTEATMFALRAARAFTGRSKIIKMEGGYHGTHDGVEYSVSPSVKQAGARRTPLTVAETPGLPKSLTQEVLVAPFNDVDAIRKLLVDCAPSIACIILEPVMGVAGFITPTRGYLEAVSSLCKEYGVLLVFDEVQTLRVARGGAQELYGVHPDLTAMGKIIGGGLPVGAFGGRAAIMELFNPSRRNSISHSGTFNGNAVTMAAGLATLGELTPATYDRLEALGERLRRDLRETLDEVGVRGAVTGVASLVNVHFSPPPVEDFRDVVRAPSEIYQLLHLGMLNRGIYIAPRGMMNLSTPMGEKEVDTAVEAFGDVLASLRPELIQVAPDICGK